MFTRLQQEQIDAGLAHGLLPSEMKILSKKRFNHLQMKEIRLGFEQGLSEKDVKIYAKKWITPEEMARFRQEIKLGDRASIPMALPGGFNKSTWFTIFGIGLLSFVLLGLIIYSFLLEKPKLELNAEEVTISCGEVFDPNAYIKNKSDHARAKISYPNNISTKVPRTYIALYTESLNHHKVTKSLIVNVIDETSPTLELKTNQVTLEEGEHFACETYIGEVYDNSSDLSVEDVTCQSGSFEQGEHAIVYHVQDRSGNETKEELYLKVIAKKEEEIIEESLEGLKG